MGEFRTGIERSEDNSVRKGGLQCLLPSTIGMKILVSPGLDSYQYLTTIAIFPLFSFRSVLLLNISGLALLETRFLTLNAGNSFLFRSRSMMFSLLYRKNPLYPLSEISTVPQHQTTMGLARQVNKITNTS